jgi:hypothetical protein
MLDFASTSFATFVAPLGDTAANKQNLALVIPSYERWKWALSIITSRAFLSEHGMSLVPILDLANHAPRPHVPRYGRRCRTSRALRRCLMFHVVCGVLYVIRHVPAVRRVCVGTTGLRCTTRVTFVRQVAAKHVHPTRPAGAPPLRVRRVG